MKPARCSERRRQRGFTLIDVIVLIVMVSAVSASMTLVFGQLGERSARALRERQATGVAQALLAEVAAMPFTYCDPQDARVTTATGAFLGGTGCASRVDAMGPEPGESRYNPANRFDGVTDYQGFTMPGAGCTGLCDRNGNLLNGPGSPLAGCAASVTLAAQALAGLPAVDAYGRPQAIQIAVDVFCGEARVRLETVRTRHAPNSP